MPLTPTAAAHARDAVAKAIFSRVFNHLVRCINKALSLPATASLPPSPRRSGRTTPKFAEEEDLAVQELEAKEAEAEAAAVAEAEAEAEEEEKEANRKERESGAGSDYWVRRAARCAAELVDDVLMARRRRTRQPFCRRPRAARRTRRRWLGDGLRRHGKNASPRLATQVSSLSFSHHMTKP